MAHKYSSSNNNQKTAATTINTPATIQQQQDNNYKFLAKTPKNFIFVDKYIKSLFKK